MSKSGWCMDAVQYLHLDEHRYAEDLHKQCKSERCDCDCGHPNRPAEVRS